MGQQLSLFEPHKIIPSVIPKPEIEIDPFSYDNIIVAFGGGKDALSCLLYLFDLGIDKSIIELWHHDIDGREGSRLMDWPVTRDYCRAVADAFGVPIYFSWKVGGFEREMLRENALTAPSRYETPNGIQESGGIRGSLSTRRMFPQVSANLSVRWCSSYLKIDCASKALSGQERFIGKKVLLVTGERAEESASRACYKQLEPHKTTSKKRHVDQWRPVHKWPESQVWEIIEKYRVNPHPCYKLGWGRCSCAACIFGSKNQWKSLSLVNPAQIKKIIEYEAEFGKTINRDKSVPELIALGKAYENMDPKDMKAAVSEVFEQPIILPEGTWKLPSGAFGENAGPT